MPELPEVQTVVNTLQPLLRGRRFGNVLRLRRDVVTPADIDLSSTLPGRAVTELSRRGKRVIFDLDDGNRLYVHLGMTGQLTVESARQPRKPHCHLAVAVDDRELRFVDPRRFGGIFWCGGDRDDPLGPEPLAMRWRQLHERLKRTRRAIKTALLDQQLVAGIGNIYADEALFAARIHPLCIANQITPEQSRRLCAAIKRVLHRAIECGGSSLRDYVDANGRRGGFQSHHRVYDRAGMPCRVCGGEIARIVVGQRSTHFCPKCQSRTNRK